MINPNLKTKDSDKLFFNKWEYSIGIFFPYCSIFQNFKSQSNKKQLSIIMERFRSQVRWKTRPGTDFNDYKELIEELYYLFKSFDGRMVNWYNSIILYTNNLDILKKLDSMKSKGLEKYVVTKININLPKGTILRKTSKFKYRLMFNRKYVEDKTYDEIQAFLNTYKDFVEPNGLLTSYFSGALKLSWYVENPQYFIDYSDEKLETIFDLMVPDVKKRVLKIATEPGIPETV